RLPRGVGGSLWGLRDGKKLDTLAITTRARYLLSQGLRARQFLCLLQSFLCHFESSSCNPVAPSGCLAQCNSETKLWERNPQRCTQSKALRGKASAVIGEKLPRGEKSPHLRVVCPSLTGASSVSGSHGMCRRGAVRGVSGGCRDGPAGSRRWASHWRGGRVRGDSILRKKRAIRNQDGPRH